MQTGRIREPALVAAVAVLSSAEVFEHGQVTGPTLVAAVALLVVAAASLLYRSRAPLIVVLVSSACAGSVALLGHEGPLIGIAPVIALYTAGVTGGRRQSVLVGTASGLVTGLGTVLVQGGTPLGNGVLGHVALGAAPVFVGEAVRVRRADQELTRERLELAARDQEERQRRRVEEERRRIARDLHDVVAHALTTINVQASVAGHLLDERPEFARQASATINGASRTALHELRGIVGLLRESELSDPSSAPGPGLDGIEELVSTARLQGVDLSFELSGRPAHVVPESVQLATFRIIQEALTNVRRHAGAVAGSVSVRVDDGCVHVLVRNDAGLGGAAANLGNTAASPGQPAGGPDRGNRPVGVGAGLVGMRERAQLLGGELEAGPCTGGGFAVRADLPYRELA